MPSTTSSISYISRYIDNYSIVPSSKLDRTIRRVSKYLEGERKNTIKIYLNKLRIIYFLRRIKNKGSNSTREYRGKYTKKRIRKDTNL